MIHLTNLMDLGFFLHKCTLGLGAGKKGQRLCKGEEPEINHWENYRRGMEALSLCRRGKPHFYTKKVTSSEVGRICSFKEG